MLRGTLRKTIVCVAPALCLCLTVKSAANATNQDRAGLRILYAGLLETDRAKDFVAFLGEHFEKVETTGYLTFTGTESADFDVTIMDHDGVDFKAPRLRISHQYDHAAIAVGVPGAFLCSGLSLKTGYL
jgi:hypothetical protein